jgi:hypothetical protein
VSGILQPGWEVVQAGNSIEITRKEPVTYYNPISLPAFGDLRGEMIERSRYKERYQITLDIVDRLSDEQYEELKAVNAETERELEDQEHQMRGFAGKGDFMPNTPQEKALYQEYQSALAHLPYHRLPDLYEEQHSFYVKTTRPTWGRFYFAREESECRAVIENIYSFADVYEGKRTLAVGGESAAIVPLEAFESRRAHDLHLLKKKINLGRGQKD